MAKLQEIQHGTRHAYMRRGCRCAACRTVMLEHSRRSRERFLARSSEEVQHGYAAYTNGCRCEVCKRAKADYMRDRRAAARAKAQKFTDDRGRHFVPDITHGRFGYEERGCRCPECMEARAAGAHKKNLRGAGVAA